MLGSLAGFVFRLSSSPNPAAGGQFTDRPKSISRVVSTGLSPARITPRSSTCSNSRTLPGQLCAASLLERCFVQAFPRRIAAQFLKKVLHQPWKILRVLVERRRTDEKNRQPVIEVRTESARLRLRGQLPVRGGDDAHIYANRFVVAHALKLAALHKTQQLRLQPQRHLANLIQKQRAPVRGFDAAGAALHGAGKCAARVPKQLGLKQRFRNRRAVDGHKRLAAARRQPMQCLGHQFFARPRRTLDQHRRQSRSHQPDTRG